MRKFLQRFLIFLLIGSVFSVGLGSWFYYDQVLQNPGGAVSKKGKFLVARQCNLKIHPPVPACTLFKRTFEGLPFRSNSEGPEIPLRMH